MSNIGSTPVYAGGNIIGRLTIDRVFVQRISSRGIFMQDGGKGIDVVTYNWLLRQGATTWRLEFTDSKEVLTRSLAGIPAIAKRRELGRKAGTQYIVPLAEFETPGKARQSKMQLGRFDTK
jgi:hypothetical protein